jgi:hypothetical protein
VPVGEREFWDREENGSPNGITIRDYFAGQFIQGGDPQEFDIGSRREVAKYAYMMADAMLVARKEGA